MHTLPATVHNNHHHTFIGGATGEGVWGYVPPLFENMGLVICPNLHRNSEGEGVGGDSTVQNSTVCILANCSKVCILSVQKVSNSSSSRQREIASPPIPNSFLWGREGSRLPAKLVRTALVKAPPVSPIFRELPPGSVTG